MTKENLELIIEQANPVISDNSAWNVTFRSDVPVVVEMSECVESYLQCTFKNDVIVCVSLRFCYLYGIYGELEYAYVDGAFCTLWNELRRRTRQVEVDMEFDWRINKLYCRTESLSTTGNTKVLLPFDMDYSEAVEYLRHY